MSEMAPKLQRFNLVGDPQDDGPLVRFEDLRLLFLKNIWDQAAQGIFIGHECPAYFACGAILAEIVHHGFCGNCLQHEHECRPLWKEQRKCCPECTHHVN